MGEPIDLTRSERSRLERLARDAECSVGRILRAVLRDGFDYTEYRLRALNDGLADLAAGRTMSLDELKARLAPRRANRARTRRQAA